MHRGDVVAVSAHANLLTDFGTRIGPEVHDAEVLDFPIEALDVVVTSKAVAGKTLREHGTRLHGVESSSARSRESVRTMPFTPETAIDRGDVLNLIGAKPHVDRVARELGYADRPSVATDMVFVGLGILLGGLIGLITVTIGNLPP